MKSNRFFVPYLMTLRRFDKVTLTPGIFKLNLVYYGAGADAKLKAAAQPLLAKLPKPSKTDHWTGNYLNSVKQLSGTPDKSLNTTGVKDSQDTFFATALYVQGRYRRRTYHFALGRHAFIPR